MGFTLVEEIGRGGMGVVWRARDEQTGQMVALKLLRDLYVEDESYRLRFEHELEIARRITSPHVVKVLGFGARENVPYIVFELVDGPSLRQLMVQHSPYDWPEVKALALQLAEGLADAHATGVLHRDVKPSNVLVDSAGTAKLADFGISRALDITRVTKASGLLGTPTYMAPEGPIDARSDLYSLGVVIYELLAGSPPFEGATYHEVLVAHLRRQPDLSKVPEEARPILAWLLSKEPDGRPQTARQLIRVLSGVEAVPGLRIATVLHGTAGNPVATDQTTIVAPRASTTWSGLATPRPHESAKQADSGLYTREASSDAPQLVIYVVDVSESMALPIGDRRRIDVVTATLMAAIRQMVSRSLKGSKIAPRYRVALFAYNDRAHDVFGGVVPVGDVASRGVPTFRPTGVTNTSRALGEVEELLKRELERLSPEAPAPLVCHVTDSKYVGRDPTKAAERIRGLRVRDGNVLLENVFISDRVLKTRVADPRRWAGVTRSTKLVDPYADCLRDMSSELPESYLRGLTQNGYSLTRGALMMLPGETPELVGLALQMSAASVGGI